MDEQQMAEWMKLASPTEEHDYLRRLKGEWKADVKMWMDPAAPPMESTGKMTSKLILGDRFLQSDFVGDPSPKGNFLGMAIDGYDRINQKYLGSWMDTMGTGWMVFEGKAEGDVRTMMCDFTDPGGNKQKMKGVTTIVNDDEYRYESFVQTPQGEFKNMEISYKR
jgi:hypothetical protein